MTLGDDLMKLSLSGKNSDPVADATKKGKVPTLGEVKRSLKVKCQSTIVNCTSSQVCLIGVDKEPDTSNDPNGCTTQYVVTPYMRRESLRLCVERRFATFKLFYHEHTPDNYEPPHFRAGDADKDKWFFTTHDQTEVPEKCSVGQVQTGWHGVDVKITSVSGYLPSTEDNEAPFLGTTQKHGNSALHLTPVEEAAARLQQVQAQKRDADSRKVVWDAENGLGNPEGESGKADGQ